LAAGLALDLLPWGRTPAGCPTSWRWRWCSGISTSRGRRRQWRPRFLFGLLTDVHDGALFGEATRLAYHAALLRRDFALHRRILWFSRAQPEPVRACRCCW